MNNQFRDEFSCRITEFLSNEDAFRVLNVLDVILADYDISEKHSTEVVPYTGDGLPNEVKWYIADLHIRCMSSGTIDNYTRYLKLMFSSITKPLKDITCNDIKAYIFYYQQQRKISNVSLNKMRQILNCFFQWCVDSEYLDRNPMKSIKKIKYTVKPRLAMTQLELEQVRQACKTVRERAIVETLYSTGCRISELAVLKIGDINWDSKEVTLFGKGSKYRTSYINAKAEVALKSYLESRDDNNPYLIVSERRTHCKLKKAGLENIISNIVNRTGLTKHITPHIFRHTTATTALENGMDITSIQKLLGHTNVATTMIYAEVNQSNVKSEFKKAII